jgi:hypothetical protein
MRLLYEVDKVRPILPEGSAEVTFKLVEGSEENLDNLAAAEGQGSPLTLSLNAESALQFALPEPVKRTPKEELDGDVVPQPPPPRFYVDIEPAPTPAFERPSGR